jgi:hypothetical protein
VNNHPYQSIRLLVDYNEAGGFSKVQKTKAAGAQSRTAFEAHNYNVDNHTLFLETVKPSRLIRRTKYSMAKEVCHG